MWSSVSSAMDATTIRETSSRRTSFWLSVAMRAIPGSGVRSGSGVGWRNGSSARRSPSMASTMRLPYQVTIRRDAQPDGAGDLTLDRRASASVNS